jgi:tetratricopeptide (TPR) repeat protein
MMFRKFIFLPVLCALLITCNGREKPSEQTEQVTGKPQEEEEIEKTLQANSAGAPQGGSVQISALAQRPMSGFSELSSISGRVNTHEINPVNYENPDINIMKQMGTQQFLISYFTGEQFYKNGNYDKAIFEYTASINSNKEFIEAFVSRGNAWLKKKEYIRAIDDYNLSIRLDSKRAELYNYRGFAKSELARNRPSEINSAIEDYTRAIALNVNYTDALINRSHAYYQTGNYDKVIEDCSRILKLEPKNAHIWNRRGGAWYNKADDDRAINDFSEAIRLKPDFSVAWQNRGNAWQSKGDFEKAAADFEKARQLNIR